jgi:hypothetical protein
MDRPPDRWVSPEYDPGFPEIGDLIEPPEDVENPEGEVIFADADAMHRESIAAIGAVNASMRRLIEVLTDVGKEIVRIDAGVTTSQRIRFRVRHLIISRATAGVATLGIGTGTYPFDVLAAPVRVDFPLVIERGVDMSFTGDGRIYLVGDPE